MNRRTLKLIALITMTIDHIGMILFPAQRIFRIIGRMSFPIFAYFVAEGCRYSSSRIKYVSLMAMCEAVCLVGYWFEKGYLYFSIMMTFIISVGIITAYDAVRKIFTKNTIAGIVGILSYTVFLYAVNKICISLDIMYGFWGCMLPLFAYMFEDRIPSIIAFSLGIYLVCIGASSIQIYALSAIIPIALYDHKKMKSTNFEKYFYYIYYPVHIALLYLAGMIVH